MKQHSRLGGQPPPKRHCTRLCLVKNDALVTTILPPLDLGMSQGISVSFPVDHVHWTRFPSFYGIVYLEYACVCVYTYVHSYIYPYSYKSIDLLMDVLEEILYYFYTVRNVIRSVPWIAGPHPCDIWVSSSGPQPGGWLAWVPPGMYRSLPRGAISPIWKALTITLYCTSHAFLLVEMSRVYSAFVLGQPCALRLFISRPVALKSPSFFSFG